MFAIWPLRELCQQVRCCQAMTSRPMTSPASRWWRTLIRWNTAARSCRPSSPEYCTRSVWFTITVCKFIHNLCVNEYSIYTYVASSTITARVISINWSIFILCSNNDRQNREGTKSVKQGRNLKLTKILTINSWSIIQKSTAILTLIRPCLVFHKREDNWW